MKLSSVVRKNIWIVMMTVNSNFYREYCRLQITPACLMNPVSLRQEVEFNETKLQDQLSSVDIEFLNNSRRIIILSSFPVLDFLQIALSRKLNYLDIALIINAG